MGDRFFDFDAAREERAKTPPPQMRAFGEVIDLPRSAPAALHLAAAARTDEQVTLPLLVELLGMLVGAERVEGWLRDHDLEEDDVAELYYGAIGTIQQAVPEAQPPETGGSDGQTSQSTGEPSKPTSNASTASTSDEPSGSNASVSVGS
jgi:hypothetical protein